MLIETSTRVGPRRLKIVRVDDGPAEETFAEAVRRGLSSRPKTLPCRYFYDDAGSRLFEQICELPEYDLTRNEDAILRDHADAMVVGWSRAPALVELGSGSSTKTRRLIEAALGEYGELHYLPIDVSAAMLAESARALVDDYAGLRVTGVVGDYRAALSTLGRRLRRPKLVAFLGSSLGNYEAEEAVELLALIARTMGEGDRLLLGTDMVKDRAAMESAYDDSRGVTAAFNRNILARINRELRADFDPDQFDHRAIYRDDLRRVEMHLVSRREQAVRVPGASLRVRFAEGESIHTENSHKYNFESLRGLATRAGFVEEGAWTDEMFRVQRWRPGIGNRVLGDG